MYFPTVINPKDFKVQTASQQPAFYFGASNVKLALDKKMTRQQIRLSKLLKKR